MRGRVKKFNVGPLEKDTEKWFRETVKKLGGRALKFTSPGTRSMPDRLVLFPRGHLFFVELKRDGKTPSARGALTAGQAEEHEFLRGFEFRVYTCWTKKDCDSVLAFELSMFGM